MSENITGVIEKLEVQGPFEGKNGKPDYDRHLFTVSGVKLTKLANVGTEPEFQEGDNVHAFFKQTMNGKFTNNYIIKLEKSTGQVKKTTSKKDTPPFVEEGVTSRFKASSEEISKHNTVTTPTSKDISMEVSGLLQALITSGTIKDVDELEKSLRSLLNIKRRVAKELEEKGAV